MYGGQVFRSWALLSIVCRQLTLFLLLRCVLLDSWPMSFWAILLPLPLISPQESWVTDSHHYIWLFTWVPGTEFRVSGFWDKHIYLLSHLPGWIWTFIVKHVKGIFLWKQTSWQMYLWWNLRIYFLECMSASPVCMSVHHTHICVSHTRLLPTHA